MRRIISMFLTLLCAGLILGAGYFVIVESGQKVLEKERVLEETAYEDTSSNIFYGKIEENIELFPWSYYPQEGEERTLGQYPRFLELEIEWEEGGMEELKAMQEWYFYQLIAWECDTLAEEVREWYDKNQRKIMDNMVMVSDSLFYGLYFYQDILELGGEQYQVRIACNEWSIISFTCMEYREGQEPDRGEWKAGKEKLVAILESSEEEMTEYFDYMMFLRVMDIASFYNKETGEYVNGYLESLHWLEEILVSEEYGFTYVSEDVRQTIKEMVYADAIFDEGKMKAENSQMQETVLEDAQYSVKPSYSYQIVELKDTILLLMQGEQTLGVYYDPIAQSFCGYNFFYEY